MPSSLISDRPKASIDIGTNSTRLLITHINNEQTFKPLLMQERMTRLGDGVNASGFLSSEAMGRVYAALEEYLAFCDQYQVSEIRAMATSATRDAANRDIFLNEIKNRTGLEVRVLSGDEEAFYSFQGVISDLDPDGPYLVCDIGGGSTEFIFAAGKEMLARQSLNVGSLRMTELYVNCNPSTVNESEQIRSRIRQEIQQADFDFRPESAIFVGGTATTLAMMAAQLEIEEAEKAHRLRISSSEVEEQVSRLQKLTIEERKKLTGLLPERAPVILTGALIVESVLNYFRLREMTVSIRDLLFGILLD